MGPWRPASRNPSTVGGSTSGSARPRLPPGTSTDVARTPATRRSGCRSPTTVLVVNTGEAEAEQNRVPVHPRSLRRRDLRRRKADAARGSILPRARRGKSTKVWACPEEPGCLSATAPCRIGSYAVSGISIQRPDSLIAGERRKTPRQDRKVRRPGLGKQGGLLDVLAEDELLEQAPRSGQATDCRDGGAPRTGRAPGWRSRCAAPGCHGASPSQRFGCDDRLVRCPEHQFPDRVRPRRRQRRPASTRAVG